MGRRVVLDTDVVVAALRSEGGGSRLLLNWALREQYTLLASIPLILEYESVATRPDHLTAAGVKGLPRDAIRILESKP